MTTTVALGTACKHEGKHYHGITHCVLFTPRSAAGVKSPVYCISAATSPSFVWHLCTSKFGRLTFWQDKPFVCSLLHRKWKIIILFKKMWTQSSLQKSQPMLQGELSFSITFMSDFLILAQFFQIFRPWLMFMYLFFNRFYSVPI